MLGMKYSGFVGGYTVPANALAPESARASAGMLSAA